MTDDNILVHHTVYYAHDAYDSAVTTSSGGGTMTAGTSASNYVEVSSICLLC